MTKSRPTLATEIAAVGVGQPAIGKWPVPAPSRHYSRRCNAAHRWLSRRG